MAHHDADKKITLDRKTVADVMKDVDICMMTTVSTEGHLHSRPMSNNKEVEWDGKTWFYAFADSSQVREIERNPNVNLAYARPDKILFVSLTGRGAILRDDNLKKEHWHKDLKMWFPDGPEDDKVVLICVDANYVYYWSKKGEGDLNL